MAIQEVGRTNHFIVQYDDVVASGQQRAQAVLASCENDLFGLTLYMPTHTGGLGDPFAPQRVIIQVVDQPADTPANQWPQRGGARNTGYSPGHVSYIRINPVSPSGSPITDDFARFLFVAEMAEQIMGFYGWNLAHSQGEALSRILAELFYPASAYDAASSVSLAPWVNNWLSIRPGPNFVSVDEPTDTNQISYGCGILFINYLRFQLNLSLKDICLAGGATLADRYRNLTGVTDDPLNTMNKVLDNHYGAGNPIFLQNNNPFPLFDTANRKVILAFKSASSTHLAPLAGIAHLSPFLGCPAKDYRYNGVGASVQWTITAEAVGFGQPKFAWHVNGSALPSSSGTLTVNANFDIPDPSKPKVPRPSSGPSAFDYSDKDVFTRDALKNVLTLRNAQFAGDYHMKIAVDATESIDPATPTSTNASLDFNALFFQYEPQFYIDQKACEDAFKKALDHLPKLQAQIDIVHTLPDPPYGPRVSEVVEAMDEIRQEVARLAETDHHRATQLAQYIAVKLGVDPSLILQNHSRPVINRRESAG